MRRMDTLRLVLELSREAMVLAREDDTIVEVSKRACEVFGYTERELRGTKRSRLIDTAEARYQAALAERVQTGAFFGEITLIRKGGARFPAEVSTLVVPTSTGERIIWSTLRDLSDRDALRETEERFRALAEATLEAVVIHKDGVILDSNTTATRLFGVHPGALVGRSLAELISLRSTEVVLAERSAKDSGPFDASAQRADGTTFPAEVRPRLVTYRGEAVRIVAIRDLTERKQMEASLALADRLASVGTLAAGVAHEINNPLAYILLNLEIARNALEGDASDAARTQALTSVRDALDGTERVRRIVSDLRTFARGSEDETSAIDLSRPVGFACAIAANEIRHRAQLAVKVSGLPLVRGNETRLGQVFLNLLVNAAQAIPEGDLADQRIEITGRADGDAWVVVDVSDTGSGIAPDLVPHVFEPFVTSKGRTEGTGLGLSIAHSIVTAIGGTLSVASALGSGTTFSLRLPVSTDPAPAEAPRKVTPQRSPQRARARVLVVDDDQGVRNVIARVLSEEHDVVTAGSGAEALEILEAAAFDAMLCDVMMPQMGGIDLHERVAARWPELARHTALLTGGAFSERAQRFVESSGLRCLEKPCAIEALEALVRELAS